MNPSDPNWLLNEQQRHRGSQHQNVWKGTAAELASRGFIAVYPSAGWWRTRPALERYDLPTRYSLVVSTLLVELGAEISAREGSRIGVFLDMCAEDGVEPFRSFSGRFNVRVPPALHADIVAAAAASGESLNQFIAETLENAVHA